MKKLIAFAFVGLLALSCTKKEDMNVKDSNIMLDEPKAEITGEATAAAVTPSVESADTESTGAAAVATPTDSTATK